MDTATASNDPGSNKDAVLVRINLPDRHPMSSKKVKGKIKAKAAAATTPGPPAPRAAATPQQPRRIVKAAHPTPGKAKPFLTAESRQELEMRKEADDDQGGSLLASKKKKKHGGLGKDDKKDAGTLMSLLLPHSNGGGRGHGAADPEEARPLDREWIQENVRRVQEDRIRSSADLRKARTRQAQEGLRHRGSAAASPGRGGGAGGDPPAKANPFSRFLSVFSVGPCHPEHKRGFWALVMSGGDGEDDDGSGGAVPPPAEKKPRNDADPAGFSASAKAAPAGGGDSSHRGGSGWGWQGWSRLIGRRSSAPATADAKSRQQQQQQRLIVLSSAVAAVAVAAAWVAWRGSNGGGRSAAPPLAPS